MFDYFIKEKADFLSKTDKSKKGNIDKGALKLVNIINSKADYYTTSSCAGRIVLLEKFSKNKNECRWLLVKHSKVSAKEILAISESYNKKNDVWFKQEPLILHVRCKDLSAAQKFLEIARKVFKRAGIISLNQRKIMIEVIGNERIETIVANRNITIDKNYLEELVEYANKNFSENKKKIERLITSIAKI